jgi:hypothetical protein
MKISTSSVQPFGICSDAVVRAAERWKSIKLTELERHRLEEPRGCDHT